MNIAVSVTRDDLDQGVPGANCACPVFLAAARAMPWLAERLSVGQRALSVVAGNGISFDRIRLPDAARECISRVDFGHRHLVAPFTFEIDIPDHLANLTAAANE